MADNQGNINASSEIKEMLEASILIENSPDKILIELPVKFIRKHLTDKLLQKFLDEIGVMIYQKLQKKLCK